MGRSAAARELEPRAIDLAVIAHIRHQHTNYDQLLMQGIERLTARTLVRSDIDRVLGEWKGLCGMPPGQAGQGLKRPQLQEKRSLLRIEFTFEDIPRCRGASSCSCQASARTATG